MSDPIYAFRAGIWKSPDGPDLTPTNPSTIGFGDAPFGDEPFGGVGAP